MSTLKLTFEHAGKTRTLNKHPVIQKKLADGTMTEAQARATAWYLRTAEQSFKLSPEDSAAITQAKQHLKASTDKPTEWKAFLEDRAAKRSITFQTIADEWTAAGMPDDAGRPRDQEARDNLLPVLVSALGFWGAKPVETTSKKHILEFATHCRAECQKNKRGTGERKADKELSAMSCLCQWAASMEKIKSNPFADRPRIQDSKEVQHCHLFMPDTDEEFHSVLGWFFTKTIEGNRTREGKIIPFRGITGAECTHRLRCVGGWLAFTALTGLRPEEPQYLFRFPRLQEPPAAPQKLPPGTIFPTRDGKLKMKVQRTKSGQNPYILLHPVLLDFLNQWEAYLDSYFTSRQPNVARALFPVHNDITQPLCSGDDFSDLNHRLDDACKELKISKRRPKGYGRAYYVRVRRSQGQEDPLIAFELGQTTNGKLIRDTYGEPDDMLGGLTFDWLPEEKGKPLTPAWTLLNQTKTETNIIRL